MTGRPSYVAPRVLVAGASAFALGAAVAALRASAWWWFWGLLWWAAALAVVACWSWIVPEDPEP